MTPSTIAKRALDLAAEVGVARRVDDVDLDVAGNGPSCSSP